MAGRKSVDPEKRKGYDGKKIPIFCKNVRARRMALGMTQARLAEAIGVPQPRVNTIEAGNMTNDCDRIIAIARALETDPNHLFGFDKGE